jgi:hypothetical protein
MIQNCAVNDCHKREYLAEIERLRAALVESYQDNLYASLHDGATGNEGKWWPGGMSTAEWFCTMAEIGQRPQFTKEELLERVPEIATKMVRALEQ